jgi:hypothetical protein
VLTECSCEGRGAEETPIGAPEGEQGLFAGAIRAGDTIQIDLDRILG